MKSLRSYSALLASSSSKLQKDRISDDVFVLTLIYPQRFVNSNLAITSVCSKLLLFFSSGYSEPQWPPASGESLECCVPPGGQAEAILWIFTQVRWVSAFFIHNIFRWKNKKDYVMWLKLEPTRQQCAKTLAACAFPQAQTKDFSQKCCHGYRIRQSVKDEEHPCLMHGRLRMWQIEFSRS